MFFMAFCSFSKARTSIWRTRSRLMPYLADRSSSVVGLVDQPALDEDVPLAVVELLQRLGQHALALAELLALGQTRLLVGAVVDQPVLPLPVALGLAPGR